MSDSFSVCTCAKCGSTSLYMTLYALISGSTYHYSGPPYVHDFVHWNFQGVTNSPHPGKLHLIMSRDPVERYVSAFHSKVKCCSDNKTSCYKDVNDHFVPSLTSLANIPQKNCLTFDEYVTALEKVHKANKQHLFNDFYNLIIDNNQNMHSFIDVDKEITDEEINTKLKRIIVNI